MTRNRYHQPYYQYIIVLVINPIIHVIHDLAHDTSPSHYSAWYKSTRSTTKFGPSLFPHKSPHRNTWHVRPLSRLYPSLLGRHACNSEPPSQLQGRSQLGLLPPIQVDMVKEWQNQSGIYATSTNISHKKQWQYINHQKTAKDWNGECIKPSVATSGC